MCDAIDEEMPEEELDSAGMIQLLRDMDGAATARREAAAAYTAR